MTHRSFYTQTPLNADVLHTDTFTHNPFTHKHFYTQSLLHTISHNNINNVYTQTLLHRNASTHKRFHTPTQLQTHLHANAFTHKLFYTQNTFTHKHLCTQALYSYSQKPISFGHPNIMLCRRVATGPTKLTIKPQLSSIFDTQTSFRAKKLPPDKPKPQTTSGFDTLTQTSFRAKGLPPRMLNRKNRPVFDTHTSFRAKGLPPDQPKSPKNPSF